MVLNNAAFIDGANLYRGILAMGWELDYVHFRGWLRQRYGVEHAYIFLGLLPEYTRLYTRLQEAGYIIIFKQVVRDKDGTVKGNCDADLVLHAVKDFYEERYREAIIVTSDGDFAGLLTFLAEKKCLRIVLSPHDKCSMLLRRTGVPLAYLSDVRHKVAKKKEPPIRS